MAQGFPPGGNVDIIARILAHEMEKGLGQSIVVEAKPGLAGALAAETIARADADGYTLLMLPSAHPAYGALSKNVKYKVVDDFTWISVASFYPFMICVKADSRFKNLKQLIDEARVPRIVLLAAQLLEVLPDAKPGEQSAEDREEVHPVGGERHRYSSSAMVTLSPDNACVISTWQESREFSR